MIVSDSNAYSIKTDMKRFNAKENLALLLDGNFVFKK